jgi:putative SOS response-associated peptidase YedK
MGRLSIVDGMNVRDSRVHNYLPRWNAAPGRKPINAKCEIVHSLPTFRGGYRSRRCIIPVDGFFEWNRRSPLNLRRNMISCCRRTTFSARSRATDLNGKTKMTTMNQSSPST